MPAEGSAAAPAAASSSLAPQSSVDLDGFTIDNRPMPQKGSIAYWQRTIWVLLDDPSSSRAVRWLGGAFDRTFASLFQTLRARLSLSRRLCLALCLNAFLAPLCYNCQAKGVSSVMMIVILLSIMSFTIASNPSEVWYTDVWVNISTGETIPDLKDPPGTNVPGASLADDGTVRRVSTLLDENRAPFRGLETFCIIIFTLEYFIRLVASPEGPGVIKYIITLSNLIDLISILPFYIELILVLAGVDAGGLTVLSVLRLIRLTRITRIFKMSKNFEGLIMLLRSLKKSGPALMMLFAFMVS